MINFSLQNLNLKLLQKVASCVTEDSLKVGRVYPQLKEIREISIQIAVEMAKYCYKVCGVRIHSVLLWYDYATIIDIIGDRLFAAATYTKCFRL